MADSCQCMAKTTTVFKVISLQLIKINGKNKNKIKAIKLCYSYVITFLLSRYEFKTVVFPITCPKQFNLIKQKII